MTDVVDIVVADEAMLFKERLGADLVEATIVSQERQEAERLLEWFESIAEQGEQTWTKAAALRCRALLAVDEEVESLYVAALALHHQTTTPFEEARTELCLGEWLRRHDRRRDAQQHLVCARTSFERLGAAPWSDRARRELVAGGSPVEPAKPPWSALMTPQELQVARTVAEGVTNKEAAAALFLSPKTVEFHLGSVYRKLGIRSRTQLTRLMTAATLSGDPPQARE
jgi:DNA-binding CsgD family transcriptional regulator